MPSCSQTKVRRRRSSAITLAAAAATMALVSCTCTVEGFAGSYPLHLQAQAQRKSSSSTASPSPSFAHRPESERKPTALMYAPPNHPTSKTAPMVAQAFYSSYQANRNPSKPRNHSDASSCMPLSNSVLSSSDTLPSFSTAHGLLSPETVMRMEVMTSSETRDEAVDFFLKTYRKDGPMACVSMLSDPKVLPRLTAAMRDIIQWLQLLHVRNVVLNNTSLGNNEQIYEWTRNESPSISIALDISDWTGLISLLDWYPYLSWSKQNAKNNQTPTTTHMYKY